MNGISPIKAFFVLFFVFIPALTFAGQRDLLKPLYAGTSAPRETEGFVFVKGGCFDMGDVFGDGYDIERPVHEVCVDDFYIGKHEVTVGEFRDFVIKTGYKTDAEKGGGCHYFTGGAWLQGEKNYWDRPDFHQTESNPVVCVSWNDANEYLKWKSRATGQRYRLATEAEWEYAARSGGGKDKWAGTVDESALGGYAWYGDNSGYETHPVGQKKPNRLGLYDMTGNVWEWVGDWYDEDYYKVSPRNNPPGPSSDTFRVQRGGSWGSNYWIARLFHRGRSEPDFRNSNLGFRCVRGR